MESFELAKKQYLESLETLMRSCVLNDLKTGDKRVIDMALDTLESMVKEAKKASNALDKAEAKAVHRTMR